MHSVRKNNVFVSFVAYCVWSLFVQSLCTASLSIVRPSLVYAQNCYNTNEDENIIEYFNLINYMGDVMIKVTSKTNDTYNVSLLCPDKQSTDMPPANFNLVIATGIGSLHTACYSDTPLSISKTNADCGPNGECNFIMTLSNKETQKVYSQTELKLLLKDNLETNPELNPASLPICLSSVVPCLADGCSLDTGSGSDTAVGNLSYNYNDQINFKIPENQ